MASVINFMQIVDKWRRQYHLAKLDLEKFII